MRLGGDVDILGEPRSAVRRMAIPFLISLLVIQANVFVDTFWISGLGMGAVSGVASAVPMYAVFMSVGLGLSTGVVATTAYRLGKGERDAAGGLAGNALLLSFLIPLACSAVLFVSEDALIGIMGAEDVSAEIHDYMLPYFLLSPLAVLNPVFGAMLRAEGAATRSTLVQLSSVGFNMVLDPILIYGIGMGLTGASLATMLSSAVGIAIAATWYVRGKTSVSVRIRDLVPDAGLCKELMGVGGPKMAEGFINNVVILLQRIFIIMASGTVGVSLFNVPFRFVSLSSCPAEALGMAAVPVISANYGKGDPESMRIARNHAVHVSLAVAVLLAVFVFAASPWLIGAFTMEESMEEWKAELAWNLAAYSVIIPLFALQGVCSSILQAVKKSKYPMAISIVVGVFRMAAFWIAVPYGFKGITVALICSYVLSCALTFAVSSRQFSIACDTLKK